MQKNTINKEVFGKRLKQLLSEKNETTYTIAEVLHLSPATISRYSTGDMAPKITTIEILAKYFNVNPAWLMGYDVNKNLESKDLYNDLSDNDILTLAAHRTGYQGELTNEEINNIKLAIKIALSKHNNI